MEFALSRTEFGAEDIQNANNTNIRFIYIPRPDRDTPGMVWKTATSEHVADMSGVAYYFASKLQPNINVPVGIICCYRGGSSAESWVSVEDLAAHPTLKTILDFDPSQNDPESNQRRRVPLYEEMLSRIIPFTARGFIWYQGEANASRGEQYKTLFPFVIERWRSYFGNNDMPFYFVQLPRFNLNGAQNQQWAELREAQLYTWENVPNTGMVVALDYGDANMLHPRKKKPIGENLADIALNQSYNKGTPFAGPLRTAVTFSGNRALVDFNYTESGFVPANASNILGFELCGEDKKFVKARVKNIQNNRLVVEADNVPNPVALRYAWGNNPEGNLYNSHGFMASPFRTDNYPYQKPEIDLSAIIAQYNFSGSLAGQINKTGVTLSTPVFSKKVSHAFSNDSLMITSNTNFNGSLANSPMQFNIAAATSKKIKITDIEIAYRSIENINLYSSDNSTIALPLTDITYRSDVPAGFKGISCSLNNRILENGQSITISLVVRSKDAGTTYSIDWIKIFGEIIDPNAPLIETPATEQFIGAAPKGKKATKNIRINTTNITEVPDITVSSTAYNAKFNAQDKNLINISFTPQNEGFETAWVYVDQDQTSASFKIKGWGLPENTMAAWSFENENIQADYVEDTTNIISLNYANGGVQGNFFNKGGNWGKMLEVANLCPDKNAAEGGGIEFINLPSNINITIKFDLQARNTSPNTLKIGSHNGNRWIQSHVIKNPRTGLGVTSISQEVSMGNATRIRIVASPDTSVSPVEMRPVNPTATLANDMLTGWSFDNVMLYQSDMQSNTPTINKKEIVGYVENGVLKINNVHPGDIIEIFDYMGRLIRREIISSNYTEIPLNKGQMTIIRCISGHETLVKKLIN